MTTTPQHPHFPFPSIPAVRNASTGCTNAWAPIASWLLGSTCCWEALLCVRHDSTRGRSTWSASRHGNRPQNPPVPPPNPASEACGGGWRTRRWCLEDQLVLSLPCLQRSNPHTPINDVVLYSCMQFWGSITMETPKIPLTSPPNPTSEAFGGGWRTWRWCLEDQLVLSPSRLQRSNLCTVINDGL